MAILKMESVAKGFGIPGPDRSEVLEGIDLEIDDGEFVAIVGYSGTGKTTLISLLAGLIQPDTGLVMFRGEPIVEPSPERALVFQNYSLLPWLSVYGNIALAVNQVFAGWNDQQRRAQIDRVIEVVNLTPARHKKPSELSGGMRQRVSLARALAMDPKVLLLDEPLGALDALTRATLQDEIARVWEQDRKTVVLITNDVDEGILLADRIIPLSLGPRACLGPSVPVDLPRPRDRRSLNHEPRYKKIRREILNYLLDQNKRSKVTVSRSLYLPDIEPEDLTRTFSIGPKPPPRRRGERKREMVEIDT